MHNSTSTRLEYKTPVSRRVQKENKEEKEDFPERKKNPTIFASPFCSTFIANPVNIILVKFLYKSSFLCFFVPYNFVMLSTLSSWDFQRSKLKGCLLLYVRFFTFFMYSLKRTNKKIIIPNEQVNVRNVVYIRSKIDPNIISDFVQKQK